MSIFSEITRITNKRDASLAKVASKGVTVPSGSTMDDLPDLIDLIVVDPTYSVSKTLTNVTSSNDDSKVIAGGSFYADLTPTSGYAITNITVTMGGVDITDQVFKPGTGAKAITANGTYNASDDSLSGYSSVVVNVSGGVTPTGTKQITISSNGTTTEDVTNYANAQITANVPNTYAAGDEGKVVSSGALVSQTSATYTTNNTYDTTLINSVTVNVSGSSIQYKTGTYTPAADYKTNGNREIVSLATIGFTPTKFILRCNNASGISGKQYAVIYAIFDNGWPIRIQSHYSNTSNSATAQVSVASWTTQTNSQLYNDGTSVYFRTTASTAYLFSSTSYTWEAYG